MPSMAEQQSILVSVERSLCSLDAIRSATERTIALLKERRAALIAAAVTGQMEIPVSARNPTKIGREANP